MHREKQALFDFSEIDIHPYEKPSPWRDEIIIIQVNSSFRNKRQVTFIFRNEIIYINVMSFGRNIMSPIYYSADKKVLNSIIDKLKVNKIVQNDFS